MELSQECLELLNWIETQQSEMVNLLENWVQTNSHSDHLAGLHKMHHKLLHAFFPVKGERSSIQLGSTPYIQADGSLGLRSNAQALLIRQRIKAPFRILLGGHMDTVFSVDSPFQNFRYLSPERLEGPGVADMKGGLIVLLYALLAFEKSSLASRIGWDVLITPDEETGSTASACLWKQYAWQNHLALVFEPGLGTGAFAAERKGSVTYFVFAKGVKAHVGRDFHVGKSAIAGLSAWIVAIHALNTLSTHINIGTIRGGEAPNIIPDTAFCTVNIRASTYGDLVACEKEIYEIAKAIQMGYGIVIEIYVKSRRPPKPMNTATEGLFNAVKDCALSLGLPFQTISTGGVCDGNILAAEGLPTIDTLGVIGGNLHTYEEWIWLPSLTQRARLTATLLFWLAMNAPSADFLLPKLKKESFTDEQR